MSCPGGSRPREEAAAKSANVERDRGFADSPLEGQGFELSVPGQRISVYRLIRSVACEG